MHQQAQLSEAVADYFRYQEQSARLKMRLTLRLGRASLLVGLLFRAVCVAGAQLVFTGPGVVSAQRLRLRRCLVGLKPNPQVPRLSLVGLKPDP